MKRIMFLTLLSILAVLASACGRREPVEDEAEQYEAQWENGAGVAVGSLTEPREEDIYENLAILGMVWGFAKYHHPIFLTGRLNWDRELLFLIPPVLEGGDVRGILYEWFVGLDEIGYGFPYGVNFNLENLLHEIRGKITSLEPRIGGLSPDMLELLYEFREFVEYFTEMVESESGLGWHEFVYKIENGFPRMAEMILREEEGLRPMADLSWISYSNLGPLAEEMLRIKGIRTVGRRAAPVHIDFYTGIPDFSNQQRHPSVSMRLPGNRLHGLFRLWNAMKYYFPHMDVLDTNWNDLLPVFVQKMLEGEDRLDYELTLAALAHHLRDAQMYLDEAHFFRQKFGRYYVQIQLASVEGQIIIYDTFDNLGVSSLARGDVIIGVNGRDIDEVVSDMRKFFSYPNEEKMLPYLARPGRGYMISFGFLTRPPYFGGPPHILMNMGIPHILTTYEPFMYIDVLRGRIGMTYRVSTTWGTLMVRLYNYESHVLLDGNIGLINPGVRGDVHYIMESFADTYGIIIDLRQQPHFGFASAILQYLLEEPVTYMYLTKPSHFNPGKRIAVPQTHQIPQNPYGFIYDRPVVLLIDLRTLGATERVAMSLLAAPNVTVIGPYSMGSGGKEAMLPLPGGIDMFFTGLGVYTPAGGQTFRVGLTPDIRVDRTIQGIMEGRDEIMEAALRFILGER